MTLKYTLLLAIVLSFKYPCFAEEKDFGMLDKSISSEQRDISIKLMRERISNQKAQFSMLGELKIKSNKLYTINGEEFAVDENTIIQGTLANGVMAEVRGFLAGKKTKIADQITVFKREENLLPDSKIEQKPALKLGR